MGSKWERIKIEQLQRSQKGAIAIGPFGSRMKSDCYVPHGIPVVRGTNLSSGPDFKGEFVYISSELADQLGSCNVYKNDLIFPHRGAIGEVGIITDNNRYVLSSSMMKLTCDHKKVSPMFLYYFFKSHKGRCELLKNASQVGTPGIAQPLSSLKQIEIELPPLDIQNKTVKIINILDDKISLNKNLSHTLEQMSQTLFKSWFVDFDPVIDNALDAGNDIPEQLQNRAELRQKVRKSADFKPLPADIRALFPAEFEETELGWIPKGWHVNKLENVLELAYGKALKKTDRIDGPYPVYGSGGIDGTHSESLVNGPGIIVGRKGTVGSLHWEKHNFYAIDTVFYVKPKAHYPLTYCFQLLKTLGLETMNTDAAVPGLNRNNAYRLEVVSPHPKVISHFAKIAEKIRQKMDSAADQISSLTHLRDTLLPKLISGELSLEDLPDLIKETEAA